MPELDGKVKKWGNSLGIVIPIEMAKKDRIKEGQNVHVILIKKSDVLRKTFGTLKLKKSAQQIKDELRAELYDND